MLKQTSGCTVKALLLAHGAWAVKLSGSESEAPKEQVVGGKEIVCVWEQDCFL